MDQIAPHPRIGAVLQAAARPFPAGSSCSRATAAFACRFASFSLASSFGIGRQLPVDLAGQHGQALLAMILELRIDHGELLLVGVHEQIGQNLRLIGGVVGQDVSSPDCARPSVLVWDLGKVPLTPGAADS